MKKLLNIRGEVWLDVSKIEGVMKEGNNGYRLIMGPNGLAVPVYLTKTEVEEILKIARIEGFK